MIFSNELLFDRQVAERFYGSPASPIGAYYDDDRGLVVHTEIDGHRYHHDLIQFDPDAMAFTGSGTPRPLPAVGHHRQSLECGDWVHISLRLGGSGSEAINDYTKITQPRHSCMVTRYPSGGNIERISADNEDWRTGCLWLRPQAVARLLETDQSRLPKHLRLLVDPGHIDTPLHFSVPLDRAMVRAVNDVLNCTYKGGARRAFIRSRYLEILAQIYQTACDAPESDDILGESLSAAVIVKIEHVQSLLAQKLNAMDTLDGLARQVGLSRSRLTQAFRAYTGLSVEAYWQGLRMKHAQDLLAKHGVAASEVAALIGYAEPASFSRAFTRHCGMPPSAYRRLER